MFLNSKGTLKSVSVVAGISCFPDYSQELGLSLPYYLKLVEESIAKSGECKKI